MTSKDYAIDIEVLTEELDSFPPFIRKAVILFKNRQYFTLKDLFETFTDDEVQMIVDGYKEEELGQSLVLLVGIVSIAEGDVFNEATLEERYNAFISITVVESLHRKKLVKAYRENYSLIDGDRIIAERID